MNQNLSLFSAINLPFSNKIFICVFGSFFSECNCNNHATACFFNPVLFSKSGNVSGGNCHGCMHNTEGVNCEFCQPNFYRHPSYPIDHPLTCQRKLLLFIMLLVSSNF